MKVFPKSKKLNIFFHFFFLTVRKLCAGFTLILIILKSKFETAMWVKGNLSLVGLER